MKFFALLLVLIVAAFGQLPNSPAVPTGAFTTVAARERYTIPAQAVSDPNTQYLRIRIDSTAPGTFSASAGCLPEFEFLAASDSQFDSQCTLTAAGTCYLQLQPGILQNGVDNYLVIDTTVGASVTVAPTLETLTLGVLAETLDQPLNGNLIPGGMAVFGPLFVSAGGGYSSTGAPNHIGVIMNSANNFEVAASFMAANTQEAINSCFTNGDQCFTTAADTCGIDVVASGNWFIVIRDNSGLGGAFNGFLELRVLPSDPDFQVNFNPGNGAVPTRGTNLNLIDRADFGLNGAFELVLTLNDPNDVIEAYISDESTGVLIGAEPCAVAGCQSVNGVCRIEIDSCIPGPFNVVISAVESATGATSVPFASALRNLVPTTAAFGAQATIAPPQTVLQVPAATPNGAITFETTTLSTTTVTGNRATAASLGSVCPDTASATSSVSFNTIIPSCVGSTGDFFFTVASAATQVTVVNDTPVSITSGAPQTGTLAGTAPETFTLPYNGVPTIVSIADNANNVLISAQTTSSSVCQSSTDIPAIGNRFVPVCAPQGSTASILVGAHATQAGQTYSFTATVNPAVTLSQGAATTFDLTTQNNHVFDLSGASGNAALYVEVGSFTGTVTVSIQQDCQTITTGFCDAAPCRVAVTNAGFASSGRYSVIVSTVGPNVADNAATITFQSGSNTCVAAGLGPCTGTTGSVSVAAGTNAQLMARATNDIAQFALNGNGCDVTDFVCGFHFPDCDANGFVTLPTQNECQAQFDSCGFSCFNACNGLLNVAAPTDSSSAATLTVFTGLVAFLIALF